MKQEPCLHGASFLARRNNTGARHSRQGAAGEGGQDVEDREATTDMEERIGKH